MRNPLGGGIGRHGRRGGCGARIWPAYACFLVVLPLLVATAARADVDEWTVTGPGGGTVRTLAIDSSVTGRLYAGTEQGGVFKSTDGGISWGTANRGLPPHADVRAVATDPADTMTLYAATRGAGVFRSSDAGAHWSAVSSGLGSLDVNALAVPAAHTLYAGTTDGGVFKSIDSGTNWVAVNAGLANVEITSLACDSLASTTVYAATQGAGVFRSADGGGHWQAATSSPRYVNVLAIDPMTPGTVYAATAGVSKSTDGGVTWIDASNGIRYSNGTTGLQILSVVIDPTQPTTLWASTPDAGVFKSTDGATTWSPAGVESPNTTYTFVIDPATPHTLYAGGYGLFQSGDRGRSWKATGLPLAGYVNAVDIDPTNPAVVYLATYGEGVFKSTDGAATWSRASAGLPSPYVNDIAIDAATPSILLASVDEGVFRSTDAGQSWQATDLGGSAHALAVAPTRPPTFWASTSGTPSGAYDVFRSTDAGTSWFPAGFESSFIGQVVVDPRNPATVYTGIDHTYGARNGGVFKSTDAGRHWARTGLVSFATVNPLAVDPESSAIVYALYGAGLLKSTDGGATWRAMNAGLPLGGVSPLLFDPLDSHRLYASAGQLFTSTDGGANWNAFASELPTSILALAIDPSTGSTLYAGTADGLLVLHRTDLDPSRATPTPTPTADPRCAPDQITVVPSSAPPGARVMLSGQCYFLHSGRRVDVLFDTTLVGAVTGDTSGSYTLAFNVPGDALPGAHQVRVVGAQSVTLEVQADDDIPTPTPTFGGAGLCPSDNMTVVPNAGPVGTRVVLSGQCYYLHSGRGGEIFFDDTSLGHVSGDTPGNWAGGFVVPSNAAPGAHFVKLGAFGGSYQSAIFVVEAIVETPLPSPTPTATRTPTAIPTAPSTATTSPTRTPTASATSTSSTTLSSAKGGGGGCAMSDPNTADTSLVFLCIPATLLARRLIQRRN